MKKVIKIINILLLLSLICTNFLSCKNKEAEKYFKEALDIIDLNIFSLSDEDFNNAINLLDKSIAADKTMWKAYRQKNQLYKARENYTKIIEVYDQWIANGNDMDPCKEFSYGCTIYLNGNKDKAMSIFSEIYNENKDKLKDGKFYKKDEINFVAVVLSGIITKNIKDISPIDNNYMAFADPQEITDAYNALSQEEKLQDLFFNMLIFYEEYPDEMIKGYVGY